MCLFWQGCAAPEKIHTHPMEGHRKFLREGVLKSQNFRSKKLIKVPVYEAELEFLERTGWGRGCKTKKPFVGGGGMDIFWNCTFQEKCSTFHSNAGHCKGELECSFHSRKYWSGLTWTDCNTCETGCIKLIKFCKYYF